MDRSKTPKQNRQLFTPANSRSASPTATSELAEASAINASIADCALLEKEVTIKDHPPVVVD